MRDPTGPPDVCLTRQPGKNKPPARHNAAGQSSFSSSPTAPGRSLCPVRRAFDQVSSTRSWPSWFAAETSRDVPRAANLWSDSRQFNWSFERTREASFSKMAADLQRPPPSRASNSASMLFCPAPLLFLEVPQFAEVGLIAHLPTQCIERLPFWQLKSPLTSLLQNGRVLPLKTPSPNPNPSEEK